MRYYVVSGISDETDLPPEIRDNLRALKHMSLLPLFKRFVNCEFVYSLVEKQLFQGESEFVTLMHEILPNLKTYNLRLPEWRHIRQLMGKPRLFSPAFLREERASLSRKRKTLKHSKSVKVNNYSLRMLVIVVKLLKVLSQKKALLRYLMRLNDEGERMQMICRDFPPVFKQRYAEVLSALDSVDKLLEAYMSAVEEYRENLVHSLPNPKPVDRPDQLKKAAELNAVQLVKHFNTVNNIKMGLTSCLIVRLISLLYQIRTLCAPSTQYANYEISILKDSLDKIRAELSPANVEFFNDTIGVHMRQLEVMMRCKNLI